MSGETTIVWTKQLKARRGLKPGKSCPCGGDRRLAEEILIAANARSVRIPDNINAWNPVSQRRVVLRGREAGFDIGIAGDFTTSAGHSTMRTGYTKGVSTAVCESLGLIQTPFPIPRGEIRR